MDSTVNLSPERPLWPAVRLGLRGLCPNCGKGRLMKGYLKLRDTCPNCAEDLSHARADDGPAYVTILIVGKVTIGLMAHVFIVYRPDPLAMALGFTLGSVALALFLLPRLKGAFVGIQWAKRMHGF